MTPLKTFDLVACITALGGVGIDGWGESDAIAFEAASPVAEDSISADGQVTINRNNDKRVYATITVRENSLAARRLWELYSTQKAQASIAPMPFLMRDTISGDTISDQYAAFLEVPMPSKGKRSQDRQFKLVLPNGLDNAALATAIAA